MDGRICFEVFMHKSGWSARFNGDGEFRHFVTRASALDAARDAARMRWEMLGKPSGVQIQEIDGQVRTDAEFG